MCNRFLIKAKLENIAARFNARLIDDFELGAEALPRSITPGCAAGLSSAPSVTSSNMLRFPLILPSRVCGGT